MTGGKDHAKAHSQLLKHEDVHSIWLRRGKILVGPLPPLLLSQSQRGEVHFFRLVCSTDTTVVVDLDACQLLWFQILFDPFAHFSRAANTFVVRALDL